MKSLPMISFVLALAPVFAGCSSGSLSIGSDQSATSGDAGGGGADGGGCVVNSDCQGPNEACAYPESEACSAKGTCVPDNTGAICNSFLAGCACDGTEINIACTPYPTGYVSKPLAHAGACGAASDAGSGAPCTVDSDCTGPMQVMQACAFPEAEACSAKGVCVPKDGVVCNSYIAGCACDGTEINIACTPYPSGYLSKPLAHDGACNDAGK